jgi:hypothetical protein
LIRREAVALFLVSMPLAEPPSVLAKNFLRGISFASPCVKTGQSPHSLLTPDTVNFRVWLVQALHELLNELKPRCGWQAQGLLTCVGQGGFLSILGDCSVQTISAHYG